MFDKRGENQRDRQDPDRQKGPQGSPPGGPMRPGRNTYNWVILLMVAMTMLFMFGKFSSTADQIRMDEFLHRLENGEVKKVTISSNILEGEMHESAMVGLESQASSKFRVIISPDQIEAA